MSASQVDTLEANVRQLMERFRQEAAAADVSMTGTGPRLPAAAAAALAALDGLRQLCSAAHVDGDGAAIGTQLDSVASAIQVSPHRARRQLLLLTSA